VPCPLPGADSLGLAAFMVVAAFGAADWAVLFFGWLLAVRADVVDADEANGVFPAGGRAPWPRNGIIA